MKLSVTREEIASCRCKLHIAVDAASVNQSREAVVRDIRRHVTVPGFRRGKAPRKMIERQYADNIRSRLLQQLVSEAYTTALEQEHLHPLSEPEIEDVQFDDQKPLTFTALLDVRPDIELGEYKGLEVTRPTVTVTEEEVEEVLQNLQERHASFESVDGRAAAIGDIVVIDFTCTIDGEPFEGGAAENYSVHLGEGRMLEGFEDNLQGRATGDAVDFPVTFPDDYPQQTVAGKTADVHAVVKEVKLKKLLPLDDEFARDVGDCDTLDELRTKVRADIEAYKTSQGESAMRDQVMERFLETSHVDVPARLHERTRQRVLQEAEQRMRQQGATEAQLEEHREAMARRASEEATRQIKSSFLLDSLAHAERLHATEADVKERIATMAANPNVDAKAVRDHFSNPDRRADLRHQIEVERVLDFLVAHATITTAEAEPVAAAEETR